MLDSPFSAVLDSGKLLHSITSARLFMSGAIMSGWCGVSPKGSLRRSMNAECMPADLAPMQSKAWLALERLNNWNNPENGLT